MEQDVGEAGGGMQFGEGRQCELSGEKDDERSPSCDTFLKKEKVVCVQFLSLRIIQWRNETVEVDIQRHRLNIREKDMFNRT